MNAYYAPNVPVHLLSIPQLVRDTNERSNLCTGGTQSILTWDDSKVSLKHSMPSGVPFLWAHVGHPASTTLFNTCRSLHDCPTTDDHAFVTVTDEVMDTCVDHHDVTEHIDANIDHLHSLRASLYIVLLYEIMHIGITSWAIYHIPNCRIWSNRASCPSGFALVIRQFVRHVYSLSRQNVNGAIKAENHTVFRISLLIILVALPLLIR